MPLVLSPITTAKHGSLSIEFEGLVPDRLHGLSDPAVARFPVLADGRPCPLGDLFSIHGDAADGQIECVGDFSRVHRLGAGMQRGGITVRGSVGRHAGEAMAGGRLTVNGDAGDWLAAGMTGGEVLVEGNNKPIRMNTLWEELRKTNPSVACTKSHFKKRVVAGMFHREEVRF